MTTAAEVALYRQTVDALSVAAVGEAVALLREVAQPNPVAMRKALIQGMPDVLGAYLTASSELAAVWYEDLRARAVGGSFLARPEETLSHGLVSGISRYAVGPLFGQGDAAPASLLASGVQKAVAGAGRATISANVLRDRTKVTYARVPRAGCCAWCAMLASRGAVYGSVDSAASNSEGLRYHGFCRCTATPVFEGEPLPYDVSEYEKIYDSMTGAGGFDMSEARRQFGIR